MNAVYTKDLRGSRPPEELGAETETKHSLTLGANTLRSPDCTSALQPSLAGAALLCLGPVASLGLDFRDMSKSNDKNHSGHHSI